MDFRYQLDLAGTSMCDIAAQHGNLGLGSSAKLIAPGDASSSVILSRMNRRDAYGMPPIGSSIPDAEGAQLLTDWINSMQSCQEP